MSEHMAGECEKHNLEWYDKDVIECPACKAEEVLREVNEWIDNWEPDFTDDEEWEATQAKIDDILKG